MLSKSAEPTETYRRAERLIESLRNPCAFAHPTENIRTIETHISWVILTGMFAYKIKKPIDLGFLDYSSLQKRKYFCHEELRLNRRLAPHIYLDVVPIRGDSKNPSMGGAGKAIEFAIKMKQFPQHCLLNHMIENGQLSPALAERIAHRVAGFHQEIVSAPGSSHFGTPEQVLSPMQQNFKTIRAHLTEKALLYPLIPLRHWTGSQFRALESVMWERKLLGFIRECHGDMHLRNIALIDDEVCIFDGIEFNEQIRWIDVISELAFLVMDLDDRGAPRLAQRILNHYLQETGDYGGLALLRFYQVYRAMVKAKVNAIRLSQGHLSAAGRRALARVYQSYITLAKQYTEALKPGLIITHGPSGSGKSTLCQILAEEPGIIWIRSDVERKRLHGLPAQAQSHAGIQDGIYTEQANARTYSQLLDLAKGITDAGFIALVDATFLSAAQRAPFIELARAKAMPWLILRTCASEAIMRQRIVLRARQLNDPSEADLAVLDLQLRTTEPLSQRELANHLDIESGKEIPIESIKFRLKI
jgi:aminoglycoside phosphotransferase family enzyme/predicted kinase